MEALTGLTNARPTMCCALCHEEKLERQAFCINTPAVGSRAKGTRMEIRTKRIYEPPAEDDGFRVLVDRVWPRGKKKNEVKIDRWLKSVAPSNELRKWFNHDPDKWKEFKKAYFAELRQQKDVLRDLLEQAGDGPVTLVYSARDEHHNNAVALREYLNRMKHR